MNKQNVVHPYKTMIFSLKKERNLNTYDNMNEMKNTMAKWKKQDTRLTVVWFHLHEVARINTTMEITRG